MQIWAESGKSALPICNYSQILYQFLTFTQNLKWSRIRQDYGCTIGNKWNEITICYPFQHSAAFPIHSYSIIHLRIFLFQICSEQNSPNIYKQNHKYQIKRKIFSYQISQYCYK